MRTRSNAGCLEIHYEETGRANGDPVILLHGFPYDVRAFDSVSARLAERGYRCIVPYLRGYGATRFRSPDTMRSGQQAAIGADLLELMNALSIRTAFLGGYDWGGRAACIVSALWPERVRGLVSVRRHGFLDRPQLELSEYLAHLFVDVKRPACGIASAVR